MRIRHLLIAAVALAALLSGAARAADRPNILFIYTDDQAPWATGVTDPLGNAVTPHMDKLINSGAQLTNAFTATPVCSPSRAELLTSRYGTEVGITDWINPRFNTLVGPEPDLGLKRKYTTWPELLQDAGYHTGLIGKWHLGHKKKYYPTHYGYDHFMGYLGGAWGPKNPKFYKNGEQKKFKGLTADILGDHVIDFIERQKNSDAPFMLSWHARSPHTPWRPFTDWDWKPYKDPFEPKIPNPDYPKLDVDKVKKYTREYLACVRKVDRNIARVMDKLKELGMKQNTVVIFTSDHGYNMGHNGIWHKGNGHWILTENPPATENVPDDQRPNMYDNSIGVPAAVVWPGVIEPGSKVDETISNLDWFPTLLAMAGVEKPDDVTIRGRNFLPLLKGREIENWSNDLYGEYSTYHQTRTHMRMYRTPEWKLVRDFKNPERDELYHLAEDPQESKNLIESDRSDVRSAVRRLHKKLIDRMERIDDPVLEKIDRGDGS